MEFDTLAVRESSLNMLLLVAAALQVVSVVGQTSTSSCAEVDESSRCSASSCTVASHSESTSERKTRPSDAGRACCTQGHARNRDSRAVVALALFHVCSIADRYGMAMPFSPVGESPTCDLFSVLMIRAETSLYLGSAPMNACPQAHSPSVAGRS